MLLKVGNYKDVQSVLDGSVTRNVGVEVFNGTENWKSSVTSKFSIDNTYMRNYNKMPLFCTHYEAVLANSTSTVGYGEIGLFASGIQGSSSARLVIGDDNYTSVNNFKAFLADQYNAGTPVIVVYPLATATTETVTGQPMAIQDGTNIVEITQASIDNLELEVSYKAGVAVTITEVENAQLDNNVEVTING
jgi:molybdopterin-binding protein